MHLDREMVCMYRRSDGISTRPDYQNTLTHQSVDKKDAPRDPFTASLHVILPGHGSTQRYSYVYSYVYVYSLPQSSQALHLCVQSLPIITSVARR